MNLPDRIAVAMRVRVEVKLKAISYNLLCSTGAESDQATNWDQSVRSETYQPQTPARARRFYFAALDKRVFYSIIDECFHSCLLVCMLKIKLALSVKYKSTQFYCQHNQELLDWRFNVTTNLNGF